MSIPMFTRLLVRHWAATFLRVATFGLLALASAEAQGQLPVVDVGGPELSRVVQTLPHGGRIRLESLFLADFGAVHVDAERFRVFAEDARVWRGSVPGSLPRNVYLRGSVDGFPGSLAVLSVRERGTIGGWILIDGTYWQISGRAGVGGLVSEKLEPKLAGDPFDCLAEALPGSLGVNIDPPEMVSEPIPAAPSATFSYTARVAVETDWEFLDLFSGDETAATDYVGDLFAFASAIYEAEIDTSLYISFLRLWPGTSSDDPWSAGNCTNQLYEFRDYWRANEAGQTRAIAHLLSGKSTGCGIAYVGALCSTNAGYGVSASLRGNFDPTDPVPPVWDILVVSHEIGHNFNSPHTHCYNGLPNASYPDPVDPCYNESGCYAGSVGLPAGCPGPRQGCGTIMSYCHLRSGGYSNIAMTFGGSVLDGSSHLFGDFPERVPERMHAYVQSRATSGCLDPVATGPTLTITHSGNGTGTVTSDDGGIDCGIDCTETYAGGASPTVTLTATPEPGSTFGGWSGDPDCDDGQVTMSNDLTCTATFTLETRSLSIGKTGTGTGAVTSSPAGIDCGIDCSETYEDGTVVTLNPSPAAGSSFIGWSGHADCSDGAVTMEAGKSCIANFALLPPSIHTLAVSISGSGHGTVTSSPAGIDCGRDCSEDYVQDTVVTLTPTADPGSVFSGWSGNADCADGSVTMAAERLCEAEFELESPYLFADGFETGDTSAWSLSTEN